MTKNIEQRTLAATATIESSAKIVEEIAHQDKVVDTPVGQRESFPMLSRQIAEEKQRFTNDFDTDQSDRHTRFDKFQSDKDLLFSDAEGLRATQFQQRFATTEQAIPWATGIVINNPLQRYSVGLAGTESYVEYLANPTLVPFETGATFADDAALGRWIENSVASKAFIESAFNSVIAQNSITPRSIAERFADVINVKDYGGRLDGINDDTSALIKARDVAIAEGKALMAQGDVMHVSGEVDLRFVRLNLDITVHFYDRAGHLVLGGHASRVNNPTQYVKNVYSDTKRTKDNPGVIINGAKNQHIQVDRTDAIRLFADNSNNPVNYSIAYSSFTFNKLLSLSLVGAPKGEASTAGWINENKFYLNRLQEFIVDGDYHHNNNVLYGGTLEGDAINIDFKKGFCNTWHGLRFESIPDDAIAFRAGTGENRLFISWTSSDASRPNFTKRYIDEGSGNIIGGEEDGLYSNQGVVFLDADTVHFDNDANPTHCNLWGVGNWTGREESDTPTASYYMKKNGRKLYVPSWSVIARTPMLPVSMSADTWASVVSGGWTELDSGFRVSVIGYDEHRQVLPATSSDIVVKGTGTVGFGPITSRNYNDGIEFKIMNQQCQYIVITCYCGNVSSDFDFLAVAVRNPKPIAKLTKQNFGFGNWVLPFNTPSVPPSSYGYHPILLSRTISAFNYATEDFDLTGKFPFDITATNFHVSITPPHGELTGDGPKLIYQARVKDTNIIEVSVHNPTDVTLAMPSGLRPKILISKLSNGFVA